VIFKFYGLIKKSLIILLALFCSFAAAELLIGNILGFPKYGVQYKMKGMRSSPGHLNIYKPYSEYWNSKGKFEIYKRNNLGLPGINVDTSVTSKYIFVLGSSFVENQYLQPELMSTSVLQSLIKETDAGLNVLNLGYNGFSPYDSFRRSRYFEEKYNPKYVILVINDYYAGSFKLSPDSFLLDKNSFTVDNSLRAYFNLILRNSSSFIRLVSIPLHNSDEQTVEPVTVTSRDISADLPGLEYCLKAFSEKYEGRFMCVSITSNDSMNTKIEEFCNKNNVNFEYKGIMVPEYQIAGDWHLNARGNEALGVFLFNSIRKHLTKIE
jgi:hypothetical protein